MINGLLHDEFPDLVADAAFDNFGDLTPPPGQVDIRLYFFTGCEPAEAMVTPAA